MIFVAAAFFTSIIGFAAAESHQVTMTNRCGSGSPVFLYEANGNPQGPTTIQGQLLGGIAWLEGFSGANCLNSGVNCAAVEFTLRNDAPNQNAADFTLEAQPANGNHQFTYPMSFNFLGACTKSAQCLEPNCPGSFTDPTNGAPIQCLGDNVGINIVFCP
ncbi:hypothetical protein EIP86_010959 [Pleurotus ostreatoroseus]|nr:hypothetical protein EIP86_010959 [Pleurotus ostreatoroseus]